MNELGAVASAKKSRDERKEKLMAQICDTKCEWPGRYSDPDDLFNEHCDTCRIEKALDDIFE